MKPEESENLTEEAPPAEDTVVAAIVTGAHGVTGNVRLKLIGTNTELTARSIQSGKVLRADSPDGKASRELTLRSLRRQVGAKGAWIGQFKEVTSRTEAETLLSFTLSIREAQRASLPEGEFYIDQLLGLEVHTDTGHSLGHLTDVLNGPAHDIYVTESGVLVPAVAEFLLQVDVTAGHILVRDIPGLREGT